MKTVWIVTRPKAHELVEDIVHETCATKVRSLVQLFEANSLETVFVTTCAEDANQVAVGEVLRSLEHELGVKMPQATELLDRKAYQEWLCDAYLECVSG